MNAYRCLATLGAMALALASPGVWADDGCNTGCAQQAGCGQGCSQAACGSCGPATVQKTIMVPQYVTETRKVKCVQCVPETRQRTVTCYQCVPETKTINVNYSVMVPETRSRTESYCVRVPFTRPVTEQYQVQVPTYRDVPADLHRVRAGVERPGSRMHGHGATHREASRDLPAGPLRSGYRNPRGDGRSRTLGRRCFDRLQFMRRL